MTVLYAPILFDMTFVPAKSSKEKTLPVHDSVPVQVRDTPAEQASIAVVATLEDETTVAYRWHDNSLWAPVSLPGESLDVTAAKPFKDNPLVPRKSPLRKDDKIQHVDAIAVRRLVSSGRTAAQAQAQRDAEGFLIVDGSLYEKSVGPVLQVRQSNAGRQATIVCVDQHCDDQDLVESLIFRADQREAAIAMVQGLFRRAPSIAFEAPDVLIPEALCTDFTDLALVRTAERLFRRDIGAIGVGILPVDFLRSWLRYTDDTFDRANPSGKLAELVMVAGKSLKGVREMEDIHRITQWMSDRIRLEEKSYGDTAADQPAIAARA